MAKYIVKRFIISLFTLFAIITFTFALMHSIPGGPFDMGGMQKISPDARANLIRLYGLNKPVYQQYVMYLINLLHGNLGVSVLYDPMTVKQVISRELPVSAKLGGVSIIFSCVVGITWGVAAALNQGKWQDNIMRVITTIGVTVPSFVAGTLLIFALAVKLRLLNPMGLNQPSDYIMPVLSLSGGAICYIARLTRSSILDVIRQDYVRTAEAKGLGKTLVIYKHTLRNALLPVVTYIAPLVGDLMLGSFVIEMIFAIPGMGREYVSNISNRDYPMIIGITCFYGFILIMTYLVLDILYAFIDPRIDLH